MKWSLQEKKGNFYVLASYKENGAWKRKWFRTGLEVKNNKRKALQYMEKLKEEFTEETAVLLKEINSELTFSKYIVEWLEIMKSSIRPNTYNAYKLVINSHIVPYFEKLNIKLRELTHLHIQSYYNYKLESISGNTVRKHHANIHKALSYAVKTGYIKHNPSEHVILPQKQRYKGNFYDSQQLSDLLNVVKGTTIETPVLLTAYYGFRRSEVLGLRWSSIDFERNKVKVEHTAILVGAKTTYVDNTKTLSSFRTLPLIPNIKAYLERLKEEQEQYRKLFGIDYNENDYICKWKDGRALLPNYITQTFKKIITENNLEPIRFHDLRHSSASLLIQMGFSLKEIQEWLGHGDIATTGNIYTHLLFDTKIEIGNKLQEQLEIK
jgi:Site-specific recombinase XerD